MAYSVDDYRKPAQGLNPNRDYVFVDIAALSEQHLNQADFNRAVQSSILAQLGDKPTPPGMLTDFTQAANIMKTETLDGDAKIFKGSNGREVTMVYWAVPSNYSASQIVESLSSLKADSLGRMKENGKLNPSFGKDRAGLMDAIITHETFHGADHNPPANARTPDRRYEIGEDGLYANYQSEMTAEAGMTMKLIREGKIALAQQINDMRTMSLWNGSDVREYSNMPDRLYPAMEYQTTLQVQKLIDEAKQNNSYSGIDIQAKAERIAAGEAARMREGDILARSGDVFVRKHEQLNDVRNPEDTLPEAVRRGLANLQQPIWQRFVAAYEHITGQRIEGGIAVAPPVNDRPPVQEPSAPPGCEGVDLEFARNIGAEVVRLGNGTVCPVPMVRQPIQRQ
jgi:hypothetical protein